MAANILPVRHVTATTADQNTHDKDQVSPQGTPAAIAMRVNAKPVTKTNLSEGRAKLMSMIRDTPAPDTDGVEAAAPARKLIRPVQKPTPVANDVPEPDPFYTAFMQEVTEDGFEFNYATQEQVNLEKPLKADAPNRAVVHTGGKYWIAE